MGCRHFRSLLSTVWQMILWHSRICHSIRSSEIQIGVKDDCGWLRKRVVDSWAHGDDVTDEKNKEDVAPVAHLLLAVLEQQNDDVQRQPANDEDGDHGDQHAVGTSTASDLCLFTTAWRSRGCWAQRACGTGAAASCEVLLGARPTTQRRGHTPVAQHDDSSRHQVLQHQTTNNRFNQTPFFNTPAYKAVALSHLT